MKKILLLFILIYPVALFSQPASGDGTSDSPYSGVVSTPWTLSGDKYCGDLTVSSGTFTISAGATLRFGTGNNLTISGTGVLLAVGNISSFITFTASGTSWGHIYFNAPSESNLSNIDYCIIEYGDVHTFTDYRGYGGAIHSNFSNLTISNSILQNNYGEWGGAIFVNASKNPTIRNCYIYNNKSDRGGGGIYCWNSSSSLIENCIFDSNQCLEPTNNAYTGGGLAAQTNCAIKVLNCTFVNNTTTRLTGASLELYGSTGNIVLNSIFWGSGTHFYIAGTNVVQYCAVQGTVPTGTGNFQLDQDNTNAAGPNFTETDGSDWSIKFISPCRDLGSTPSPTVPNDYIGNLRIGNYDIGAYEVQYSRWKTNPIGDITDWTDPLNWEQGIYPGSGGTGDVVIPKLTGSTVAPNISETTSIASGKQMILNPGAKATFGTLSNSGTLKLESDADSIASLILSTYTDLGTEAIELYLTGGGGSAYKWHYVSSPVASLPVSTFAPTPTIDFAQFIEALPTSDVMEGWIGYDGYKYLGGGFLTGFPYDIRGTNLIVGQGYNYYKISDYKVSFSGSLNTADVAVTLGYAGLPVFSGFNLLGNPFSSGLDWDIITGGTYPSHTSKGLYFTRNNAQCTYIAGVGTPGDVKGIIPPMQGFFVKANGTPDIQLTLPAAARTHNKIHARYKGSAIIPLVRLSITENSISDETVVRFDVAAKTDFDYDFDAIKMFLSSTNTSIYSSLSGTDYAINGQPFPATFVEIPVTVNLTTDGNHSILASQLQGLDDYDVTLRDNSIGFTADLKTTPLVTFSASPGTITARFVLKISNLTTGTEDPVLSKNTFNIYSGFNLINIQTIADEWEGRSGSVRVLDLAGRIISDLQNREFSKNSVIQVQAPGAKGLYIVEIRSGVKRYVGKVVIK